jgi:signal transduction histidine kinase
VAQKRIILILFISFCSFRAVSQNIHLIDSLRDELKSAEGLTRLTVLNDLAWEYRSAYPDSTVLYAQQAFELGKRLNVKIGLAEPLNFIGVAYNYKGDRIKSYEYYDQALKLSIQQHDSIQTAYSNNNLGRLFFEQGVLGRAYDYFIQALALFENINDQTGLAYTYQSLARLYKSQGDNIKAENNYLKANKIRISLGNTNDITSAYIQTGKFYQEVNQHEKALQFLHLADSTASSINDEIDLAEVKTHIAKSYLHQGKLNEAQAICAEGLKVILQKNNVRMQAPAYLAMGQIKMARNELGEAKKYFQLALEISSKTKELTSKMDAHLQLSRLSEKQRNRTEQLDNLNQYLILQDSIKDLDLARQVERLQFEIEIERKERENELLKIDQVKTEAIIKQQRLQNIILIIIVAFVSLLGFIQWRSSKKRNEINEKLAQQNQFIQNQRAEIVEQNEKLSRRNQQLSDINHEKDTLMGIVAHDLKSPLNRIKGIADLMEFEGGLTKEHQSYVKMTKDATQAGLDLIKDLLDVHMLEESVMPNYSNFDISSFLLEKTNSFIPAADAKSIHLHISKVESENVYLDADYLSRIIDNLITNAIKFSNKNSSIEIAATRMNGSLAISIKDQGQGFSEKDKLQLFQKFKKLSARPTAGESSNGLGLAIVKTLVDRMKGSIELVSDQGKGSHFILKFPAETGI